MGIRKGGKGAVRLPKILVLIKLICNPAPQRKLEGRGRREGGRACSIWPSTPSSLLLSASCERRVCANHRVLGVFQVPFLLLWLIGCS